jgi:hypothetical protein
MPFDRQVEIAKMNYTLAAPPRCALPEKNDTRFTH